MTLIRMAMTTARVIMSQAAANAINRGSVSLISLSSASEVEIVRDACVNRIVRIEGRLDVAQSVAPHIVFGLSKVSSQKVFAVRHPVPLCFVLYLLNKWALVFIQTFFSLSSPRG